MPGKWAHHISVNFARVVSEAIVRRDMTRVIIGWLAGWLVGSFTLPSPELKL
jgi:hypothetical protein